MVNPLDEPTMGGLNGSIDMQPRREQQERNQEQVDAWRWGLVIVAVLVVAYAAFMWYSIFGGKP